MARDPDVQTVVYKDSRGRRGASQKIRDWGHIFRGARGASEAVSSIVRAAADVGLIGALTYAARPKLLIQAADVVAADPVPVMLKKPITFEEVYVQPTYMGRVVLRIDLGYPDLGIAEGIGILAILSNVQSASLFGVVTDAAGAILYHNILNGTAITWPVTITTAGLFATRKWERWEFQTELQGRINAGTMAWPDPAKLKPYTGPAGTTVGQYLLPIEMLILPVVLPRWLYAVGNAGFIAALLRRTSPMPDPPT